MACWWPCLLKDRDKMSNFYRESSIDASYQVSVHFLEINQSETRMASGGHVC
jgi:hypothetical protein